MILGFGDRRTASFASGGFVSAFQGFEEQVSRRLAMLNAATSLEMLRQLPGNRLETLRGNRAGQFSIRINQPWRICFNWPEGNPGPTDVEMVDYHQGARRWFCLNGLFIQGRSSKMSLLRLV